MDQLDLGYIALRLDQSTERIIDKVFGPLPKTPRTPTPPRPETSESVRKKRLEDARIAAAKKKLEGVNLDDPIYGNNANEHKLRFSSIGYEIVDAEVVPTQTSIRKVTKTTV